MEGWQIALIVKPLALLLFFFVVRVIAVSIERRMQDSLLKRVLYFSWRV